MYFKPKGFLGALNFERPVLLTKAVTSFSKELRLLKFLQYDFKKSICPLFSELDFLELRKGKEGVQMAMMFSFFRNNMRAVVYIRRKGFLLLFLTGGHVAKQVLGIPRVYKRDKKGDGALAFIGKKVKKVVKSVLKCFKVVSLILMLKTYFKRYHFFRLIVPYVFKRLRRQVLLCIPRGHNSMESSKRWRRRRR